MKDSGYGIFPTVLSVCYSPNWWIDGGANVHVCMIFPCFPLIRSHGLPMC
jgi:hypothetical protein